MDEANKESRWHVVKNGAYYRPKAQGYTAYAWMAGLFTYEEAWAYSHPNGDNGPRDGIEMVYSGNVTIGLGGWLEKVEVHQPGTQGYTDKSWMAGLFTYEEAWHYSHPNGENGPRDGIEMLYSGNVTIGLGGWLEKVEVHQPGTQGYNITETLKNWFFVTDADEIIAYFRDMDDAFTFKLDYINGKLNK